jgi:hypothetical protein
VLRERPTAFINVRIPAEELMKKNSKKVKKLNAEQKYAALQKKQSFRNLEASVKSHFKDAKKSVEYLRDDLLKAHGLFASEGCNSMFSTWLKKMEIPRSTAYYVLGKKNVRGKYASTGSGNFGAALRRKQRKAKTGKTAKAKPLSVTAVRKLAVATLKNEDLQTVMNTLRYVFSQCFPDSTADLQIVDSSVMRSAEKGNVFVAKHSLSPAMASLAEAGLTINKKGELVVTA